MTQAKLLLTGSLLEYGELSESDPEIVSEITRFCKVPFLEVRSENAWYTDQLRHTVNVMWSRPVNMLSEMGDKMQLAQQFAVVPSKSHICGILSCKSTPQVPEKNLKRW